MKAIVRHKYGSPDVLKLEEIPEPTVGDDEVLVKVQAVGVNAATMIPTKGRSGRLQYLHTDGGTVPGRASVSLQGVPSGGSFRRLMAMARGAGHRDGRLGVRSSVHRQGQRRGERSAALFERRSPPAGSVCPPHDGHRLEIKSPSSLYFEEVGTIKDAQRLIDLHKLFEETLNQLVRIDSSHDPGSSANATRHLEVEERKSRIALSLRDPRSRY